MWWDVPPSGECLPHGLSVLLARVPSNLLFFNFLLLAWLSIASVVAICMWMMATDMSMLAASIGTIFPILNAETNPPSCASSRGMLSVPPPASSVGLRGDAVGGGRGADPAERSGSPARPSRAGSGCAAGTSGGVAAFGGRGHTLDNGSRSESD